MFQECASATLAAHKKERERLHSFSFICGAAEETLNLIAEELHFSGNSPDVCTFAKKIQSSQCFGVVVKVHAEDN